MAKEAANSFGNYSGLDRQAQLQTLPSAVDRQGDPAATQALRDTAPWALGLAERGAQQSGRSFYDPARQAERWVRGTGSQDQTQAADAAQDFNDQANPIPAARKRAFGPPGRGVLNQGKIAGFDVTPSQIPQTVGDPNAAPGQTTMPSFNMQPPPNVFANPSMNSPAQRQSQYSIGSALNGNGLTLAPNQLRPRIPANQYY